MKKSELYRNEILDAIKAEHASAFVGAGFSKNAQNTSNSLEHMLDWNDMTNIFAERLQLDKDEMVSTNPLSIAQEYEDIFGRANFDNLLLENLSDENKFQPTRVYYNLLELPWTDIFTTNYDRLLERAAEGVAYRRYSVILDQKDLLYSAGKPRIIKLHGSFPSNRPFVMTEEDFRKYPYDHSAFVNTVQQSLIENTFVLVGFSGKDPNFLKWIGWVRDNLGTNYCPKMYIITYGKVSNAEERMLQNRNIEQVDLSELYPDISEYSVALDRFFDEVLSEYKEWKKKTIHWPQYESDIWKNKDYKTIRDSLKSIHGSYPGWIMLPQKSHWKVNRILTELDMVLLGIKDSSINNKDDADYISGICDEYAWFHRIIGKPIHYTYAKKIKALYSKSFEFSVINPTNVLQSYMNLLFSFRLNAEYESWNNLVDYMVKHNIVGEDSFELTVERAEYYLFSLEWSKLDGLFESAVIDESRPDLILKWCGIISMRGRSGLALSYLEKCISKVRLAIVSGKKQEIINYNGSLESCLVALYKRVKIANSRDDKGKISSEIDGCIYKGYEEGFDWELENERYLSCITDNPYYQKSTTTNFKFDIGLRNRALKIGENQDLESTYKYLSFREITGFPFLFELFNLNHDKPSWKTIGVLSLYAPYLAAILAVQTGNYRVVQKKWDRLSLLLLDEKDIDKLTHKLLALARYEIIEFDGKSMGQKHWHMIWLYQIAELISRLFTRCKKEKYADIVLFFLEMYKREELRYYVNTQEHIGRIVNCMSMSELLSCIDIFWKYPLSSDSNYPDPFEIIADSICKLPMFHKPTLSEELVSEYNKLINISLNVNDSYSNIALVRAICISRIYQIGKPLKKQLKEALWYPGRVNEDYALPRLRATIFSSFIMEDILGEDSYSKYLVEEENLLISELQERAKGNVEDDSELLDRLHNRFIGKRYDYNTVKKYASEFLLYCENISAKYQKASPYDKQICVSNLTYLDTCLGALVLSMKDQKSYLECREIIFRISNLLCKKAVPHALLNWIYSTENGTKSDRKSDGRLVEQVFDGNRVLSNNANLALITLSQACNRNVSGVVEILLTTLCAVNSYDMYGVTKAIDLFIRGGKIDGKQLHKLITFLQKFDDITKVDLEDNNSTVMKKIMMRQYIFNLAHTIYAHSPDKSPIPELKGFETRAQNGDEFADVCRTWR